MKNLEGSSAAKQLKLDERNHVEEPLLKQLHGLGWEVIDLDAKQHPGDSHRASFTEVVQGGCATPITPLLKLG